MLQLTQVLRAHRDPAGDEPASGPPPPPTAASRTAALPGLELVLGYEDRRRSRLRVSLSDGREAALILARGTVLRDGDRVVSSDGAVTVTIRAADENLSVARASDPHLLARAAYHLGNRHVPLQVRAASLSYQHDHVLDGLVRELGLSVSCEPVPFEPEAGGYRHLGTETSPHSQGHGHDQGPGHDHPHGHLHSGHRP